jgi:hypothetical protein
MQTAIAIVQAQIQWIDGNKPAIVAWINAQQAELEAIRIN